MKSEVLKEIIESRRSVFPKDYSGEPIPQVVLEEILSSGSFAPNHKKTKPWRYLLLQGEEKNELGRQIAEVYKNRTSPEAFLEKKYNDLMNKALQSSAVIVINVEFSALVPEWEEIAAVAMGVQNMYLTCTVYNVGCYWASPSFKDDLGDYLQLSENQKCLGFLYMGMKKEEVG